MIRTIVQCDICKEEITDEGRRNNLYLRVMPTDGCEMHFHISCFQKQLTALMQSSPHCNQKLMFMRSIIKGEFIDGWSAGL